MPTTKSRYMITDTGDTAWALDVAQRHWPDLPRQKVLLELVHAGARQLQSDEAQGSRQEAIGRLISFAGTFPDQYLENLRSDWPE